MFRRREILNNISVPCKRFDFRTNGTEFEGFAKEPTETSLIVAHGLAASYAACLAACLAAGYAYNT